MFSSGSAIPVPQKSARKRVRDRGDDDHGPEPDLEAGGGPGGDADGLWRRGRSGQSGGSDPRRRVSRGIELFTQKGPHAQGGGGATIPRDEAFGL